MKKATKLLVSAAIGLATILSTDTVQAQAIGQWDFNNSNLTATAGSTLGDMTYNDGATAAATQFGTTTGFAISNILSANAIVMKFPVTTNGIGYRIPTPPANNGGAVNQYTFIADVYYTAASANSIRPLIQTEDGTHLGSQQFIVIDANGAIGPAKIGPSGVAGPFVGQLLTNTWYRIAISVTAGGTNRVYTNGVAMGSFGGGAADGFFALDPNSSALVLSSTDTNSASGYVNSIQIRDSALNAGQVAALGAASAAGIPVTIPPVPSFIDSRTPDVAEIGVSQAPAISIVLNQGDTTISGTPQLKLDGVAVAATVTPAVPIYTITYTVPPRLDPLSVHTLTLIWTDNVAGNKTNTWSFTVKDYQIATLPAPFYFENFDSLTENATPGVALPAGWTVQNQTGSQTPGLDLAVRTSDTYKDWVLITGDRLSTFGANRTNNPTIILNGAEIPALWSGNLMYAESDVRGGNPGEYQELYTANINCTGRSNVFVAWNSIYMQNQDNLSLAEYSVDNGANWLPVIYYLQFPGDDQSPEPDVRYTNGVIDCCSPRQYTDVTNYVANSGGTWNRIEDNRNWSPDIPTHATNYGIYLKAPINASLNPYIKGRVNDSESDGKRVEIVRLPAADNKATVKLRFLNSGTGSWFWGIDNLGLYEINTPVITTQPANATIAAGTGTNFTVVASSPSPLSYQWQHAGTNISNGGHYSGVTSATLVFSNVDTNDAGSYKVKVSNSSGDVLSNPAILAVATIPTVTTQPISVVTSEGFPASFSASGFGGLPLSYQWYRDTTPVAAGATINIASAQSADAGNYTVVINNSYGSVTSRVAHLTVVTGAVTNKLVVHLKFDGNYSDSSPVGTNIATPVGSPSVTSAGKIGNALKFTVKQDGSEISYATLGYPADLKFGPATDFSMSFWVNYSQSVDDPPYISNKNWGSSDNRGWIIADQAGGGNFRVQTTGTGGTKFNTTGTPVVKDGTWHHIAVCFDRTGSAVSTYKDGALVSSLASLYTGSVDTDDLPVPLAVNIGQDGTGNYTDGGSAGITNALIDDVGIWRRAISPQEALAIYNAGQAGQSLAQASLPLSKLSISRTSGNITFSWAGGTGIRLQKNTALVGGTWTDIVSTLGNSSHTEAIGTGPAFYRLFKP